MLSSHRLRDGRNPSHSQTLGAFCICEQEPCTVGYYCAHGARRTRCSATWGQTAAERCPRGTATEPPFGDLFFKLLVGIVPIIVLIELASVYETRRRSKKPVYVQHLKRWVKDAKKIERQALREAGGLYGTDDDLRSPSFFKGGKKKAKAKGVASARKLCKSSQDAGQYGACTTSHAQGSASPPPSPPCNVSIEEGSSERGARMVANAANASGGAHEEKSELVSSNGLQAESLLGRTFLKFELNDVDFHIGKAHVLRGLNTHLTQGNLVGLMGESGSGKTTLLNVLGGRADYGHVTGEVTLNKRPFRPSKLRHVLGYVPQAHLLFKELTVYENLMYAGKLRLDRHEPESRRIEMVENALDLLRLQDCRHFVCDPAIGQRLSGGQMRRIGIGIELVCNPPILLLDEPTSALDAVNTRLVVAALKALADRGVLVIASLHQPRLTVYQMLDVLVLLRQGEMIYGGLRKDSVRYFEKLGFELPPQANPADFFIEVAFGHEDSKTDLGQLVGKGFNERLAESDKAFYKKVTAEELGRLFRQHYKNSQRFANTFMLALARNQSSYRSRAIAILQYAKQTARMMANVTQVSDIEVGKPRLAMGGSVEVSSPTRLGRKKQMSVALEYGATGGSASAELANLQKSHQSDMSIDDSVTDSARHLSGRRHSLSRSASTLGRELHRLLEFGTAAASSRSRARAIHRNEELAIENENIHVEKSDYRNWFLSDDGYGESMMRPELAEMIWERAAKKASKELENGEFKWAISDAFAFRPRGQDYSPAQLGAISCLPKWAHLREEIMHFQMPKDEKQPWHRQFRVCCKRYLKKVLRTRAKVYSLLAVAAVLGLVCGGMYGDVHSRNDIFIYFLLFNTFFGSIVATATIQTLGTKGLDGDFFKHEALSGVFQTAECCARLLIDLFTLIGLAPVFVLILGSVSVMPIKPLLQTWLLLTWALSPIGYVGSLVAPSNADVLTSGVTFVICAFTTGFFGVRAADLSDTANALLDLSPGRQSFFMIAFGTALEFPHSLDSAFIYSQLLKEGLLPNDKVSVSRYESSDIDWFRKGANTMIVFGFVLRLIALVNFWIRANINLSGEWRHFKTKMEKKWSKTAQPLTIVAGRSSLYEASAVSKGSGGDSSPIVQLSHLGGLNRDQLSCIAEASVPAQSNSASKAPTGAQGIPSAGKKTPRRGSHMSDTPSMVSDTI